MPVSWTELPILSQFVVASRQKGMPAQNANTSEPHATLAGDDDEKPKALPKGVVLDKNGKPCRSCTSVSSWMAMAKSKSQQTSRGTMSSSYISGQTSPPVTDDQLPEDCPPDVERLGRSTWTLLHTMTATYPVRPSPGEQAQTRTFLSSFSKLYPCGHCAEDFREWISQQENEPRVGSRDEFGKWMCEAHNAVNEKLGKSVFDCDKWEERWRTGPENGRCG